MAPKAEIRFTYKDHENLPTSETKCYELSDEELVTVQSPTTYHQSLGLLTFGERRFEMAGIHGRAETLRSPLLPGVAINPAEILES